MTARHASSQSTPAAQPAHRGPLRRFFVAARHEGFGTAAALARRYATDLVDGYRFDRRYGVETRRVVRLRDLTISSPNVADGVSYRPISRATLAEMLDCLPHRCQDYTFVDLGSGKGRALLVAAERGFPRIIGVEFSRELYERSKVNVASYVQRTGPERVFELHHEDAAGFDFPLEPLVVLLYNPFGEGVMRQVLERLERSLLERPRDVVVLYRAPECAGLLEASTRFRVLRATRAYRVYHCAPP